ncbi:MAG: hypothetical protein M3Y68_14285 [Chloroflexota bacterium]|nr:hypothetical protein [Chloroflexota bacterium]
MQQKKIFHMVSAVLIILFIAACSPPPVAPTLQQPSITETQPAQASPTGTELLGTAEGTSMPMPDAGLGLCANTYYPVRQGATWTYKSTGGPAGEYSFTDTITAVGQDSFTLTTQIGGLINLQDWNCTPDGLLAHQLGGAPAAMLNSQGIQLTLNATHASGVVFPSQINPGDTWQHTLDVAGNVTVANEEAEAAGTAQMNFSAIGNESVTVPAGTFDALKIQVDTTLNVDASYEGITLPVAFSGTHTYWFVPGVGWVKSTGTGNFLAASFSETTELQSYSIP